MEQVRLIALDIDGTLVNDQKEYASNMTVVFDQLLEKNILICICSGRQIYSLYRDFPNYKDKVIFIGENGAMISIKGELTIRHQLSLQQIEAVLNRIGNSKEIIPILSGIDTAFIPDHTSQQFHQDILPYYPFSTVKSTNNIDGVVLKIAAYHEIDANKYIYQDNKDLQGIVDVCVSGRQWCDFNPLNCNKGDALSFVLKELNLSKDNLMAVGDSGNDITMLQLAKYPVAMKNAIKDVLDICDIVTPLDNNSFGCINYLVDEFNLKG